MKKISVVLCALWSVAIISFCLIGCSRKKSEETAVMEMQTQTAPSEAQLTAENLTSQAAPRIEETKPSVVLPEPQPPVQANEPLAKPGAEEIQTALQHAGYYSGAIDGKIGPKTKKAIEDFQKDNGLVVDGKVGAKTWSKLQAYLNTAPAQKTGD